MSDLNRICVIASSYPQPRSPERGAFIQKLVGQWQNKELKVDVIAPKSIPNTIRSITNKKRTIQNFGEQIERPSYISLPKKKIGPVNFRRIARNNFLKAVQKGTNKISIPDIYYGKFLMRGGYAALQAGQKFGRPAIADLGESRLIERFDEEELKIAKQIVPLFDGFACVSQRLIDEVIELGAEPEKILYAPNTVDTDLFYPRNKDQCRKRVGLPSEDFIVAFVGHFIHRKGPLRVLEAINSLDHLPVKGIFMGRGKEKPEGDNVLHVGAVPNNKLPLWLNAADVFVLPTLAEGYCNAINEAMACGLPVISSDIKDVQHQLTDNEGILVNPLNTGELANAIKMVFDNSERLEDMRQECIRISKERFSEKRGVKILDWLNKKFMTSNLH